MFWREHERTPWDLRGELKPPAPTPRLPDAIDAHGKPVEFQAKAAGPWLPWSTGSKSGSSFEISYYSEHALSASEEAAAIAYIQTGHSDGRMRWGAGVDTNIELASVRAGD